MAKFGVLVLPRPEAPREVKLLEEMGFDVALIPDSQALAREVYVTLTACAANTSRITLGTGITNPFTRHPSVTAAAIASLNDFSGGRALLGIGRGDSAVRKIGHEIVPLKLYRAYIEAVRGLLAGEVIEYEGARFALEWLSRPVQQPVPVDMAASGPKNLALAGELADRVSMWLPADAELIARAAASVRAGADRVQRDPATVQLGAYFPCFLSSDLGKAREVVRGAAAVGVNFFAWDKSVRIEDLPAPLAAEAQKLRGQYSFSGHGQSDSAHARLLSEAFIDWACLVGSAEACVDKLRGLFAQGLQYVYFLIGAVGVSEEDKRGVLKVLAEQVLPHFK
jgi:5,10-methylenetetrahydromethanopterin reductase